MSVRDELVADLISGFAIKNAVWVENDMPCLRLGEVADYLLSQGWRPPMQEISTVEELEALPNNEEMAIPQEAVEAACNAFQHPNRMLLNTSDGNRKGRLEAALEAALPYIEKEIRAQAAADIWEYWDACGDLIDDRDSARQAIDAIAARIAEWVER